jgi:hypothetical protein
MIGNSGERAASKRHFDDLLNLTLKVIISFQCFVEFSPMGKPIIATTSLLDNWKILHCEK